MRSPFVNINLGLHLGLCKILFWYHYTSKQDTPVKRCRKVPTIDSSLPAWIRRASAVYERMLLWVPRSGQTGISLPLTWNPSGSRLLLPVPASWLSAGLATACSCRSPCEPGTGCNILKCNSNLSLHCCEQQRPWDGEAIVTFAKNCDCVLSGIYYIVNIWNVLSFSMWNQFDYIGRYWLLGVSSRILEIWNARSGRHIFPFKPYETSWAKDMKSSNQRQNNNFWSHLLRWDSPHDHQEPEWFPFLSRDV